MLRSKKRRSFRADVAQASHAVSHRPCRDDKVVPSHRNTLFRRDWLARKNMKISPPRTAAFYQRRPTTAKSASVLHRRLDRRKHIVGWLCGPCGARRHLPCLSSLFIRPIDDYTASMGGRLSSAKELGRIRDYGRRSPTSSGSPLSLSRPTGRGLGGMLRRTPSFRILSSDGRSLVQAGRSGGPGRSSKARGRTRFARSVLVEWDGRNVRPCVVLRVHLQESDRSLVPDSTTPPPYDHPVRACPRQIPASSASEHKASYPADIRLMNHIGPLTADQLGQSNEACVMVGIRSRYNRRIHSETRERASRAHDAGLRAR